MPRPKAPCGTYSAYKRHLRDGSDVDDACRQASKERSRAQTQQRKDNAPAAPFSAPKPDAEGWEDFDRERREAPPEAGDGIAAFDRGRDLRWNLELVKVAMQEVAEKDAAKLAPLSKRHSELLLEIEALEGAVKEVDPFDEFLSGDFSNVIGFQSAKDRKTS